MQNYPLPLNPNLKHNTSPNPNPNSNSNYDHNPIFCIDISHFIRIDLSAFTFRILSTHGSLSVFYVSYVILFGISIKPNM